MSPAARRVSQAGLAYLVGGTAVVLFTATVGLSPALRQGRLFLLGPGLLFIALFGVALVAAPRLWHRPRSRRRTYALVRVLALSNAVRTLLFLLAAAGWNVHVMKDFRPALFVVRGGAEPLFLIDATVTGFIAFMMIRAVAGRE